MSACLIGSCTNSSYEDIYKAASVAKQALANGLKSKVPFLFLQVQCKYTQRLKRRSFENIRRLWWNLLANACGPCIGQWQRDDEASKAQTLL